MKLLKWILAILAGIFLFLQFFQPDRNLGNHQTSTDLFEITNVNDSIKNTLISSCYDCHSNHTDYPWYSYIAPLSFVINKHVMLGKEELNFSTWGSLSTTEQIVLLVNICEVLENNEMPLKSYFRTQCWPIK